MRETWVWSLGWEDPLEKEMATHSNILPWRIPWTEEPGGLQSTGSQRVRHDWATSLSFFHFNDFENCDSVITHLEPDILECEVKWALGSMTRNKVSGGVGIPVELFQILKKRCCESAALNMPANLENSAVATGLEKRQYSFQSQRKVVPKNVQTTAQLHSFHRLGK